MTIKLRFALLLSLLLGSLLIALGILRGIEQDELDSLLANERQSRAQLLNHWIDLAGRSLPQFAADTAQAEEFGALLAKGDLAPLRVRMDANLGAAGLNMFWLLRADGTIIAHGGLRDQAAGDSPLTPAEFVALVSETPSPRFFVSRGTELLEVCARRIPAANPLGAAWLIVARRWDDAYLRGIGALAEARVTLRGAQENVHAPTEVGNLVLLRPLNDWRGHPLRVLHVEAEAVEIMQTYGRDRTHTLVFVGFGLLTVAAMALALQQWVVRPLSLIGRSLENEQPMIVAPLIGHRTELARVAQLVHDSFAQRAVLKREIEDRRRAQEALERSEAEVRRNLDERARLGRDLHDGVIQSLYAAGMGLAGIRAWLTADQTEAAARLEQTRGMLNETIHDVRNFIMGLEPEALKLQTFSQAVTTLLDTMRSLRAFQSTIEIDEELAKRLTLAQRVHALQIIREAVSNALRHGEAGHIDVTLRALTHFAELQIRDNGSGFDPAKVVRRGGLGNFAQRANELGAELAVESKPGEGTLVKLTFALLIL